MPSCLLVVFPSSASLHPPSAAVSSVAHVGICTELPPLPYSATACKCPHATRLQPCKFRSDTYLISEGDTPSYTSPINIRRQALEHPSKLHHFVIFCTLSITYCLCVNTRLRITERYLSTNARIINRPKKPKDITSIVVVQPATGVAEKNTPTV